MKQSLKNFLQFNGKAILFLSVDGDYWIALKPICDALNVDWVSQLKSIKRDQIFGSALSNQTMQIPDDQVRNMVCLPEKYIYGWLISLRSKSPELLEYKKACYDILYEYFHGTIGKRHSILSRKAENEQELHDLEQQLRNEEIRYARIQELKGAIMRSGLELKKLDEQLVDKQLSLLFN